MKRRDFLAGTMVSAAAMAMPRLAFAQNPDFNPVWKEIEKRHDEAVQRLQTWIKQPSIAAENRGMNEGCNMMMQMLRDAGFQQVLMLLTFLHTRPGAVLLLDEPDAHLHMILQDAIYAELRTVAIRQHSQLVIATHSEVIINAVEPRELCAMLTGIECVVKTSGKLSGQGARAQPRLSSTRCAMASRNSGCSCHGSR